jgi:hypothetical protein
MGMRCAGCIARMKETRNLYKILGGKPEEKSPFGRHRCRLQDNIKTNFREIRVEWCGRDTSVQDWDRWRAVVHTAVNLRLHKRCVIS